MTGSVIRGKWIPTFTGFLLRGRSLALYRRVLRKTRGLNPVHQAELRLHARTSIEAMRHVREEYVIKQLIHDGHQEIDTVDKMLPRH
jgi:hypothetical protein